MRLTRDRALDLGGRAIPTALVLDQYDFLIGLQKAFHRRDRTWISLRGTERKWGDRNRDAMLKKVRSIWITAPLGCSRRPCSGHPRPPRPERVPERGGAPAAGPARAAT